MTFSTRYQYFPMWHLGDPRQPKKYQLPLQLLYASLLLFSFHIVRIHLSDINIVHWGAPFSYVSSGFSSQVLLFTNVQENSQARGQTCAENWKNFSVTFQRLSPCIVLPAVTHNYSWIDTHTWVMGPSPFVFLSVLEGRDSALERKF